MNEAEHLADLVLNWLRDHYGDFRFFTERDLVWTMQGRLESAVRDANSKLRIFNDYPMIPGSRRARSTDIAMVSPEDRVELALEFKYEPCHQRIDVLRQKLPVVFWGVDGVAKDVERVRQFVSCGKARAAQSYFVDEGGHFAHRPAHPGSVWIPWGRDRWLLESRAPSPNGVVNLIPAGEQSLALQSGIPESEVEKRFD